MSEPRVMYRAFFAFQNLSMWHPDSPVPVFTSSMHLSPCGQYVELRSQRLDKTGWETTRQDRCEYWQPTKEQAYAVAAPRLRQIGERLIAQAEELEAAATPEISDRPALVEVAESSQPQGSPIGRGE